MMVLSRKPGEEIVMPQHGITFRILEIRRNCVRLGVSAPEGVSICRTEIWQRVQDEQNLPDPPITAPRRHGSGSTSAAVATVAIPPRGNRIRREEERLARALADVLHFRGESLLTAHGPAAEEEIEAAERELGKGLPRSFRTFLRGYGGGTLCLFKIFGICRDSLACDVVLMNELGLPPVPDHCIRFARDHCNFDHYFDTSRMGPDQECPVVVFGPGVVECTVAGSFLEFLQRAARSARWESAKVPPRE